MTRNNAVWKMSANVGWFQGPESRIGVMGMRERLVFLPNETFKTKKNDPDLGCLQRAFESSSGSQLPGRLRTDFAESLKPLKIHISKPSPRPTESESPGLDQKNLYF